MKKRALLLSALALFAMPLVACNGTGNNSSSAPNTTTSEAETNQDKQIVESVLASLSVPETASNNFTLVTSGAGGATISWTSSNPEVIAIDGGTAVVTASLTEDLKATLTATVTKGSESGQKTFEVSVPKREFMSVNDVREAEIDTAVTFKAIVSGFTYYNDGGKHGGTYVTDETGTIMVFGSDFAEQVVIGDELVISGTRAEYQKSMQVSSATITSKLSEGNAIPTDSFITGKHVKEVVNEMNENKDVDYAGTVYLFENTSLTCYQGTGYSNWEIIENGNENGYINLYFSGNSDDTARDALVNELWGTAVDTPSTIAFVINGRTSKGSGNPRGNVLYVE